MTLDQDRAGLFLDELGAFFKVGDLIGPDVEPVIREIDRLDVCFGDRVTVCGTRVRIPDFRVLRAHTTPEGCSRGPRGNLDSGVFGTAALTSHHRESEDDQQDHLCQLVHMCEAPFTWNAPGALFFRPPLKEEDFFECWRRLGEGRGPSPNLCREPFRSFRSIVNRGPGNVSNLGRFTSRRPYGLEHLTPGRESNLFVPVRFPGESSLALQSAKRIPSALKKTLSCPLEHTVSPLSEIPNGRAGVPVVPFPELRQGGCRRNPTFPAMSLIS